jgi:HAD superfamily hydrolase (TIGR01450 family)
MVPLVEEYRAFAIDLDGVVWRGERFLDGAVATLERIQALGKQILLLTNNGSYSRPDVEARLKKEGLEMQGIEILTSIGVAIRWVESNGLRGASALVVAQNEVVNQLSDVLDVRSTSGSFDVVIVGRDTAFDYGKLTLAADAIRGGAAFIALNRDLTMPVESGFVPGTGALVAAIEAASGFEPVVLGKPHAPMMNMAVDILGPKDVLMVGDRVDSDIVGAQSVGWDSALVSTGAGQPIDIETTPTYLINSLENLFLEAHH